VSSNPMSRSSVVVGPRPILRTCGVRAIMVAAISAFALMVGGTATASAAPQYWLHNSQTNPTTHCYTGYGPSSYRDLLPVPPAGASTAFSGQTLFGCTPAFPAGGQLGAGGGSFDVWFTNTGKKSCTTSWFLLHNATPTHAGQLITGSPPYITVPARTNTPTPFTVNFTVPETTLPPGDQLMWMINVRTRSGSCSSMTLYYGGAATPSTIRLPTLVG
jgi:hypothetical protein